MDKSYQVAAIPVRQRTASGPEVLLVTSRETRRWVVPKGWPWRKHANHEAAAGEAWEEAGVRGSTNAVSIGTFTYEKRDGKKIRTLKVFVYLLEVTEEADTWPEVDQRRRAWFAANDAADLVDEPELKALLRELAA